MIGACFLNLIERLRSLLPIPKKSAGEYFALGRDRYAIRDFSGALDFFQKAAIGFTNNLSMKSSALESAAASAEKLDTKRELSAKLYFEAARTRTQISGPNSSETTDLLRKSFRLGMLSRASQLPVIAECTMLAALSQQNFADVRKLIKQTGRVRDNDLITFREDLKVFLESKPKERQTIPFPATRVSSDFPELVKFAELVGRESASLEPILSVDRTSCSAGETLYAIVTVKAHHNATVTKLTIRTGEKGVIQDSESEINLPKEIRTSESQEFRISLLPQLSGVWKAGPSVVFFEVEGREYSAESNLVEILVKDPQPVIWQPDQVIKVAGCLPGGLQ